MLRGLAANANGIYGMITNISRDVHEDSGIVVRTPAEECDPEHRDASKTAPGIRERI
jgi:hypothetical protein